MNVYVRMCVCMYVYMYVYVPCTSINMCYTEEHSQLKKTLVYHTKFSTTCYQQCIVETFLDTVARQMRKATNRLITSVCAHGIAQTLWDEFSRNFIFGALTKICQHVLILVKLGHKLKDTLREDTPAFIIRRRCWYLYPTANCLLCEAQKKADELT
jgi:hypothetical protein